MPLTVEATYENGVLKLTQPLPLKEHQKVQVTVHTGPTWAERTAGMMGGAGSIAAAEHFAMSPALDFPYCSQFVPNSRPNRGRYRLDNG
jgi:predicted DNA-binding antitoxin AbrB/MazE fold protein